MSSSTRGGAARGGGRGRGLSRPGGTGRGASNNSRGRGQQRASPAPRGTFGQPSRAQTNGSRREQMSAEASTTVSSKPQRAAGASGVARARGSWQDRYAALQESRTRERAEAIRNGIIADPDKPRSLADAITLVGTCQDMCGEFERVERVVQKDVWAEERDATQSVYGPLDREPDEFRMVKKFRRAAAGLEEQLPSDLRPPLVLQKTCDYLFNDIIGNASEFSRVHHFVWDRTRAIRNDFSIQQLTKSRDLTIAVDCYERIARFHLLSLHQLAVPQRPYDKYDWQQEREQLDRTFLSLMQYYDDGRGRIPLPNEAEFRAYWVIFQMQDPVPDLEDRIQTWPREITLHPRVNEAIRLYGAACNTIDMQGPLKPPAAHAIAQQDWFKFWQLVESKRTSYLMGCVAEIYFNLIRRTVLQALLKSGGSKYTVQWTIEEVRIMLALDNEQDVEDFVDRYGLTFIVENDKVLLDLSVLKNKPLPDAKASSSKQLKSELVEQKRCGRSFPAVINGLTVRQARQQGMVEETAMDDEMQEIESANWASDAATQDHGYVEEAAASDDDDGLFVRDTTKPEQTTFSTGLPNAAGGYEQAVQKPFSTFGQPTLGGSSTSFGKPSLAEKPAEPSAPTNPSATAFKPFESATEKPKFNFLAGVAAAPSPTAHSGPASSSIFSGFKTPISSTERSNMTPFGSSNRRKDEEKETTGKDAALLVDEGKGLKEAERVGERHRLAEAAPFESFQPAFKANDNGLPRADFSTGGSTMFSSAKSQDAATTAFKFSSADLSNSAAPSHPQPSFLMPQQSTIKQPPFAPWPQVSSTTGSQTPQPPVQPSAPKPLPTFDFLKPVSPKPAKVASAEEPRGPMAVERSPVMASSSEQQEAQPVSKQPAAGHVSSSAKPTEPDLDSIISDLATEMTLGPYGFIEQFAEFAAGKIITEIQEKLYFERLEAEAKAFRTNKLGLRYGLRWRDICRRLRLKRQGQNIRRRARERLRQRQSGESPASSIADTQSLSRGSRVSSRKGSGVDLLTARRDAIDKKYQQSLVTTRWSTRTQQYKRAHEEAERDNLRHALEDATESASVHDQRIEHAGHVDQQGRITKPKPVGRKISSILGRTSFINDPPAPVPLPNTMKSNYFRQKARGLVPYSESFSSRARKRQLEEMATSQSTRSPASPALSSSITDATTELGKRVRSSSDFPVNTKLAKLKFDDDPVIVKARAARLQLQELTTYYQTEITKMKASPAITVPEVEYASPSLDRARQEVRLRLAQEASEAGKYVPAYRLRQSKFVPREDYPKAIERGRILSEERWRNASRPASSAEASNVEHPPPTDGVNDYEYPAHGQSAHPVQMSGFSASRGSDHGSTTAFAPLSWIRTGDDHRLTSIDPQPTHEPTNGNGFTIAGLDENTLANPTTQTMESPLDFTVKPSQIPESLSSSFGQPNKFSTASLRNGEFESTQSSLGQGQATHPNPGHQTFDSNATQQSFTLQANGIQRHDTAASIEVTDDEMAPSYGHANPYSLLANHGGDSNMNESIDGDEEERATEADEYSQDEELYDDDDDDRYDEHVTNHAELEYGDEVEGEYDEESETEADEDDANVLAQWYGVKSTQAQAPKFNEALNAGGHTQDDAIELSD